MTTLLGVLRAPSFRRLFLSRTVSLLGSAIAPIALAFAVLGLPDGSPTDLGLVLFARSLAMVLFLLLGGVLADRLPRYRLMVTADLIAGASQLAVAVLFLSGTPSIGTVMALEAVGGGAAALFMPAATGLVPQVIDAPRLREANVLIRLSTNTSAILGAAIGGVIVAAIGPGWGLVVDSASYGISAVLLAGITISHRVRAEPSSMLSDLRHGWREFTGHQWLWVIVVQFAVLVAAFGGGFQVLGPVVADAHLGGAGGWAVISGAESIGLVLGSILALRLHPRRPMRTATIATFAFALPLYLLAIPAPVYVVAASGLVMGVCSDVFGVLWDIALQTHIPNESLSRVSSYDAFGSFALGPLGLVVAGPVADAAGVPATLIGAGTLIVLACTGAMCSPSVRRLPAGPVPDPA